MKIKDVGNDEKDGKDDEMRVTSDVMALAKVGDGGKDERGGGGKDERGGGGKDERDGGGEDR